MFISQVFLHQDPALLGVRLNLGHGVLITARVPMVNTHLVHLDLFLKLVLVDILSMLDLCELVGYLLNVLIGLIKQTIKEVHLPSHHAIGLLLLHMHLHGLAISQVLMLVGAMHSLRGLSLGCFNNIYQARTFLSLLNLTNGISLG